MLHHLTLGRNKPDGGYVTDLDWQMYCQELLDAIGLDYTQSEDDDTQNEICISLDEGQFSDVFEQAPLCMTNECTLATALLNHELGECCTRVEALTPAGDTIIFK